MGPWWTTDIGGFYDGNIYDEDFRELLVRWFQFGTFCPVMRAMFYEFPEDAVTWELNSQYMYGSDILVAPIVEEHAVFRKVYLPKGSTWTHAGTGEVYEGGQWVEVKAEIDTFPIFLQDGKQSYLIGKI